MPDPARTVFLSYRREVSWALAQLVFRDLTEHGFDVFMDTASLDSGEFERVILAQIESRAHFLLLLEPRSLDRIGERRRLAPPRGRPRADPPAQHRAAARRWCPGSAGRRAARRRGRAGRRTTRCRCRTSTSRRRCRSCANGSYELTELPALRSVPAAVSQGLAALRIPTLSAHSVRMGVQLDWTVVADVGRVRAGTMPEPRVRLPHPALPWAGSRFRRQPARTGKRRALPGARDHRRHRGTVEHPGSGGVRRRRRVACSPGGRCAAPADRPARGRRGPAGVDPGVAGRGVPGDPARPAGARPDAPGVRGRT